MSSSSSSEQEKCSFTSFLPMSCRGRAEAFARSLHSRLRSLGSQDGSPHSPVDESSWLAGDGSAISVTQPPPRTTDTDLYLDLGFESPGSPEEELDGAEIDTLLNQDGLRLNTNCEDFVKKYESLEMEEDEEERCSDCENSGEVRPGNYDVKYKHLVENVRNDSDSSDGQFYDTEIEITNHERVQNTQVTNHDRHFQTVNTHFEKTTNHSTDFETDTSHSTDIESEITNREKSLESYIANHERDLPTQITNHEADLPHSKEATNNNTYLDREIINQKWDLEGEPPHSTGITNHEIETINHERDLETEVANHERDLETQITNHEGDIEVGLVHSRELTNSNSYLHAEIIRQKRDLEGETPHSTETETVAANHERESKVNPTPHSSQITNNHTCLDGETIHQKWDLEGEPPHYTETTNHDNLTPHSTEITDHHTYFDGEIIHQKWDSEGESPHSTETTNHEKDFEADTPLSSQITNHHTPIDSEIIHQKWDSEGEPPYSTETTNHERDFGTETEMTNHIAEKPEEVLVNGTTPTVSVTTVMVTCVTTSPTFTASKDIGNTLTVEMAQNRETKREDTTNGRGEEDDDMEMEERPPRVRRCSSLRSGKTPPGTPGCKKIVRFADVLGLDLADVRTFLDEIPKVPTSAYNDLVDVDLDESDLSTCSSVDCRPFPGHGTKVDRVLVPLFQQPGGLPDFLDKVRDRNVYLENAMVQDPVALTLTGIVRVRNLDFHKSVHVRYSLDSWQTIADVQATYLENSCDGFSDKFSFSLNGNTLTLGQRIEFAVRFQCKGIQYWDNNNGVNYCFQCLPSSNYSTSNGHHPEDEACGAGFY